MTQFSACVQQHIHPETYDLEDLEIGFKARITYRP